MEEEENGNIKNQKTGRLHRKHGESINKLPNTTTMESLQIKVSAGEGAVLKMGDKSWLPTTHGKALLQPLMNY